MKLKEKIFWWVVFVLVVVWLWLSVICIYECYYRGVYEPSLIGNIKAIIYCIKNGLLF